MDRLLSTESSMRTATDRLSGGPAGYLRQEYAAQCALFEAQPALVQHFLESQGRQIADALVQHLPQVRFTLPDRVVTATKFGENSPVLVPPEAREEMAGGLADRLTHADLVTVLRQRLAQLEQSPHQTVVVSAQLIRHAAATYMVHGMLPAGRSVEYATTEGDEIPSVPIARPDAPSALTAATNAIAEQEAADQDALLVPYVLAARRFYLPQWVAFDDDGNLLANSTNEAEAYVASMQGFLSILHAAIALAPYIVVDEDYQQKRYGMLGQLLNQGRALARHETDEIIRTIQRRAAAHQLNRGLSLSLPYFDDQALAMQSYELEVIPSARITFVPAFVVRAAREEQVKVAQDTRLSPSTRRYLLAELKTLVAEFEVRVES